MARKKNTSKNTRYKFDLKDNSIVDVKWNSPNDKKYNNVRITADFRDFNFVTIRDNH